MESQNLLKVAVYGVPWLAGAAAIGSLVFSAYEALGPCFVAWGCLLLILFVGLRRDPGQVDAARVFEGIGITLVALGR